MANGVIGNKLWSACNKMLGDPGTSGSLQYVEQFSWLLFLRVYEDVENEREAKAKYEGREYKRNIEGKYRWSEWASKDDLTGQDLIDFVSGVPNKKGVIEGLFPYLRSLKGNRTKEIIAEIFNNTQNRMEDGYVMREVIDIIAGVDFFETDEHFAMSSVYEGLFSRMKSNEVKPLAEFYTPRSIARFMTEMVAPQLGQTVYDPCNGPSGFLIEAFQFMEPQVKSTTDRELLHTKTLYGKELKSLPFILGMMNMILNGIEEPNIIKTNTLNINLFNLEEKYDVILTNPPFKGSITGVSSNFPYPSKITAILFLQHVMRSLKKNGKCAIIFPEGVLFQTEDKAYVNSKKELLENFNLHHIVRLPKGAFAPYTDIPTNILFFDEGGPTEKIWYYDLPLPEGQKNFTKTRPIKIHHFDEARELWNSKKQSDRVWIVDVKDIIKAGYNLDIKNPNYKSSYEYEDPKKLIQKIRNSEENIISIIGDIEKELP